MRSSHVGGDGRVVEHEHHGKALERPACKLKGRTSGDALVVIRQALPHLHAHVPQSALHEQGAELARARRPTREDEGLGMRLHRASQVMRASVGGHHEGVLPGATQAGTEVRERRDAGDDLHVQPFEQRVEACGATVEADITAHDHACHSLRSLTQLLGDARTRDKRDHTCVTLPERLEQTRRPDDQVAPVER